jgi:hypothetical protein
LLRRFTSPARELKGNRKPDAKALVRSINLAQVIQRAVAAVAATGPCGS